jgi:hypothetical protein
VWIYAEINLFCLIDVLGELVSVHENLGLGLESVNIELSRLGQAVLRPHLLVERTLNGLILHDGLGDWVYLIKTELFWPVTMDVEIYILEEEFAILGLMGFLDLCPEIAEGVTL